MSTEALLTLVVHGTPGTAGSKSAFPIYTGRGDGRSFTGRVTVAEKDRDHTKANWRQAIITAALAQISCTCTEPDCHQLSPGYPLDEALVMSMIFTVAKPSGAPKTKVVYPVARPDLLKYARAAEDALKVAGVFKDDARVVEYARMAKVYPREDPDALDVPGLVVRVWRMADLRPGREMTEKVAAARAEGLF